MAHEAGERHTRTQEEAFNERRLFQCSRCGTIADRDGFFWSRRVGIKCKCCQRYVYVLAARGPSPYQHWPWQHEPSLSEDEAYFLLSDQQQDGLVFLSLEDHPYYERLRDGRKRRRRMA